MKKLPKNHRAIAKRSSWNAYWRIARPRGRAARNRSNWVSVHNAPEHFCVFSDQRDKMISFLEDIRADIKSGCRSLIIDFSKTAKFISGGTILLYSELDRLLDLYPKLKISCRPPFNNKAAQVLKQIGLFSRLGKNFALGACSHDDIINWRVAKGHEVLGEKFDVILGKYDGVIAEALQEELYEGITEAMTNAKHHAYIAPRQDGIRSPADYRPWWMFSQEKDGMLSVVFCDLGVGIPNSLPFSDDAGWKKWYLIMARLGLNNKGDAKLIQGAIRHSRTRTREHNRGKGLTQIVETIAASVGGRAIILSNRGWYQIQEGKETFGDYDRSINGTIISWQMPLVTGLKDERSILS